MAKQKTSSLQTYQQLMKELDGGKLRPFYFLTGDEQFFTDRIQDKLLSMVPPEAKDFNLEMLYGQDVNVDRILDVVRSFPMMGERRYVFVREFFQSTIQTEEGRETLSLLDNMVGYLERPMETTVLVMHDQKKPHKNSRFYKALDAAGAYFEFDGIDESSVPDWIMSWTKSEHKKEIQPDAAAYLHQIAGSNLHQLSTELEKVCTFNRTDKPVSVEDVKAVTGFSRQYSGFELKDAVVSRDLGKSVQIAEQILRTSQTDAGEIIRNIALMYSTFSSIWQYQRLKQKGATPDQIMAATGFNAWRQRMIAAEAAAFRPAEMPGIFEALLDADRAIKGFSKLDREAIFIMMIKRIVS